MQTHQHTHHSDATDPRARQPATPVSSHHCAQVLIHHEQAQPGDVLHVFLDGEYHHAIDLPVGRSDTNLAVPYEEWRTNELVHSIDVYKASANGYVQDHQSILVSIYQAWGSNAAQPVASSSCDQSHTSAPEPAGMTQVVEYRVSKDGMTFSRWSTDYQEPSIDGSDDGNYVVQMRFVDSLGSVLDVQTVAFEIRCGERREA